MIGRNVTVDGLIYTPVRDAHRYSGRYISVSGLANVHVEEGTSVSEGEVPDISAIGHIPPQDIVRLGRHKAAGTVRAVWGGKHFLLETDAGEASVDVLFSGQRSIISDATAHAVLNIVRELVANAVRHGKAKSVRISGSVDPKRLEVSVRDDGCGFDADARPRQEDGHFGLDGIVERIERLGGAFELESAPGKGTCATIKVMRNRGNP